MQYNADLIRKLLFVMDAKLHGINSLSINDLYHLLPGYTPDEISNHVLLLQTQNCLDVQNTYLQGKLVDTVISKVTLDGQKLFTAAGDSQSWSGFLKTAKSDNGFINNVGFSNALISVLYSGPIL